MSTKEDRPFEFGDIVKHKRLANSPNMVVVDVSTITVDGWSDDVVKAEWFLADGTLVRETFFEVLLELVNKFEKVVV